MTMALIAPSILAADPSCLGEAVKSADLAGGDWIHLDIMDGHFVPNLTYGPPVVKSLRKFSKLPFDAHLMVSNPDELIQGFLEVPVQYLSVHQETCPHLHRTLSFIKDAGCKAGVALNPATPVETLIDVFPIMDFVVLMAVNPGFSYQKHIATTVKKIIRFMELADLYGWNGLVQVDGGVGPDNAGELVASGADVLVAGGAAFSVKTVAPVGSDEYIRLVKENIDKLKDACRAVR